MNSNGEFRKKFSKFVKEFEVVSRKFLRIKKCKKWESNWIVRF